MGWNREKKKKKGKFGIEVKKGEIGKIRGDLGENEKKKIGKIGVKKEEMGKTEWGWGKLGEMGKFVGKWEK